MPKLAPWRVAILAKESGDFGENGKLAKMANFAQLAINRQRAGNIQNVANIQTGCQKWLLEEFTC